jgi:hypothetical protein
MKSLKEIVETLRDCGYTCEAGPLDNNEDFRTLAKLAGAELPKTLADCLAEAGKSAWNLGLSIAEEFGVIGRLAVLTPQDMRDEIIKEAKRDVAELERYMDSIGTPPIKGNIVFNELRTRVKFFVNREKRAVTALIYDFDGYDLLTRGIAKCDQTDCFNVHIGKAIALRRALGLEVPMEYLKAPQPTELRVGDVVNGAMTEGYYCVSNNFTLTGKGEKKGTFLYSELPEDYIYREQIGAIIDDSREEVAE